MAELNKPYIRVRVSPYGRQSKPYTRQSEPYTRKWLAAATQKIFQDGIVFTFQDGSKYVYQ